MLKADAATRKDQRTGLADMQHRHFATVAAILRSFDGPAREQVILHFADNLACTNARFDRARFLAACAQ